MALWLEVHCDKQVANGCYSKKQYCIKMRMIAARHLQIVATVRELEKEAIAAGWVKYKHEMVCPACVGHRP